MEPGTAQSSSESIEPNESTSAYSESSSDSESTDCQGATGSVELPKPEDILRGLDVKTTQEVQQYMDKHGVQDLGSFFERKLSEYKDAKINIAVTGNSGVGKSSFINCIRGLNGDDEGAAAVGVTETTMEVQPYPHPDNENLIIWDLPGLGTFNFPKEEYLKEVKINTYDMFLILTNTRFTENDLYIAQEVQKLGKVFFLIRTKIDLDIQNDKDCHPRTHNRDEVLDKVKRDCVSNLTKSDLPHELVFLISNTLRDRAKLDFPDLMETIVKKAPGAKKTSLILSLTACSEKAIDEKFDALKGRIAKIAIQATLLDNRNRQELLLRSEVEQYRKQFGLTCRDIEKMGVNPRSLSKEVNDMISNVEFGNFWGNLIRGLCDFFFGSRKLERAKERARALARERARNKIEDCLLRTLNKCANSAREVIRQAKAL